MDRRNIALFEFFAWVLIILFIFGIFFVTNKILNKSNRTYYLFSNDVDGLIVGSPVKLMGVQIGHVSSLKSADEKIYVEFCVTKKEKIPTGSYASVEFSGLGGSKSLEIYPPETKPTKRSKILYLKKNYRISSLYENQINLSNNLLKASANFAPYLTDELILRYKDFLQNDVDFEFYKNFIENLNKKEYDLIHKIKNRN